MSNQTNKSFVLHTESLELLSDLSDQQAGKLFKAILNYQKTGNCGNLDQLLKFIISPLIFQFKRDEEKYQTSIIAGKLGNLKKYHKKIYQKIVDGQISLEEGEKLAYPEKSIKSIVHRPPITTDQSGSLNININDNININKNIDINKNKKEYLDLADGLIFILETKMNKKLPSGSQKSYAEEIRKLIEIDLQVRDDPLEDVKKAIQSISDNWGKEYFPIVQSGKSLREKFSKIENYRKPKSSLGGFFDE